MDPLELQSGLSCDPVYHLSFPLRIDAMLHHFKQSPSWLFSPFFLLEAALKKKKVKRKDFDKQYSVQLAQKGWEFVQGFCWTSSYFSAKATLILGIQCWKVTNNRLDDYLFHPRFVKNKINKTAPKPSNIQLKQEEHTRGKLKFTIKVSYFEVGLIEHCGGNLFVRAPCTKSQLLRTKKQLIEMRSQVYYPFL